jgi:Protein of unknown function (DUF2914)
MTLMTGLSFLLATASFPGEVDDSPRPEVELAIGYKVKNHQLETVDGDNLFLDGDRLVAWTSVSGLKSGFIEHVWYRDDVEVARFYLPVGAGRRWRTWSRHTASPGAYQVQVLGPDGTLLRQIDFVVDNLCGE